MKIAILSRNPKLYSTRRLVQAARKRGHKVEVIDVLRCYMNIQPGRPEIWYRGEALAGFDAVIPRIGASVTFYGTAVVRQFEMQGVYSLNESVAITRARDKLRALQLLARKGIGLPRTGFAHAPDDTAGVMQLVGGAPITDIPGKQRIPDMRMVDIKETGAELVAVGCPQCTAMLEGVVAPRPEIKDIAELVAEVLIESAEAPAKKPARREEVAGVH